MNAKQKAIFFRIILGIFISIIILIVILLLLPNFIYQVDPGYVPVTEAQISATVDVLENYRSEVNHYPSTSQGLKALYEKPAGLDGEKWKGPYITKREIPKDGWYRELHYQCPGAHNPESYDLWSYGKDGKPGGTGWNADIGNW